MKENDYILDRMGKKQSFTVPEHYFEDFASQLIANLPERQPNVISVSPVKKYPWHYWLAAAAVVCSIALCGTWLYQRQHTDTVLSPAVAHIEPKWNATPEADAIYIDELLDYALVDNSEIALYLTGSN